MMLENATVHDSYVQEKNWVILEKYSSHPSFCVYLLFCLKSDDLSIDARCTAASLMRRYICSVGIEYRKIIKTDVGPIAEKILNSNPCSFSSAISALIASMIPDYGSSVFPNLNQTIIHLLSDENTIYTGLELLNELLLIGFSPDSSFIEALVGLLDSEYLVLILKVECLFAQKYPEMVKNCVLSALFGQIENLSDEALKEMVDISCTILSQEYDDVLVEFLFYCMNSDNEIVSIPSVAAFNNNENIPYIEQITKKIYFLLSTNDEINDYNLSSQCIDTLEYICSIYTEETLSTLLPIINLSEKEGIICSLRGLSVLSKYLENIDSVFLEMTGNINDVHKNEIIFSISKISFNHPSMIPETYSILFPFLNDSNGSTRMQTMRCLTELFPLYSPNTSLYIRYIINSFEIMPIDEKFLFYSLIADFLSFCDEYNEEIDIVFQNIYSPYMDSSDSDPFLALYLDIFEKLINREFRYAQLLSAEGFSKMFESLGNTLDDEASSKIINIFSSLVPDGLYLISPFVQSTIDCILKFIDSTYVLSKMCSWAVLSKISSCFDLQFREVFPSIFESFLKEDPKDLDHDIAGNIAFSFSTALLNQPDLFTSEISKHLFNFLEQCLLINQDNENLQNIAICTVRVIPYIKCINISKDHYESLYFILSSIENERSSEYLQALDEHNHSKNN